jgi:hypothetical protein
MHKSNTFNSLAHSKKDRFYPKSRLNAAKTQERPKRTVRFGNLKVLVFPTRVGHTGLKMFIVWSTRPIQMRVWIWIHMMKSWYLQITRSNNNWLIVIHVLGLGGHELEKGLSPIVAVSKPTGQNTKPNDDVPTSFNRINQHASKVIGKSKKMMWVSKGNTPIKTKLITQTLIVRTTLKSEPHMTSKVFMSKYTNKKTDPWSHGRTWNSRRQLWGQKIASGH